MICLANGFRIGFYNGNPLTLIDDLKALQPSYFSTVPRVLSRMHNKILEEINKKNFFVKWLFYSGLKAKKKNFEKSGQTSHLFYDKLIFNKIKQIFGGKINLIYVASAPVSHEI